MRIAFVVNSFPLVSEVFIMNSAAALAGLGHEVDLYALDGAGPPGLLNPAGQQARLLDRLHVPPGGSTSAGRWRAAPAAARQVTDRLGFSVAASAFHLFSHRRRVLQMRPLGELAMFAGGPPPDVLHCQFGSLGELIRRHRRAGGLDAPLVTHFRGNDLGPYVARHGQDCYARLFREGDAFIANSRFFRDRAVALGCPPDAIRVVESPVHIEGFPYRPPTPPEDRPLRLLTVGRLVEKKGIADAIAAVALLRARGHAVSYRIIGEGRERPNLEALVARLGLADCVTLLGSQPHAVVQPELAAADLFLAPSVTAANGDSDAAVNTLKEAMLTGVPPIATRHGGIPELVEDGVTGLLVPERDPPALAAAVETLLADPAAWRPMAERARRSVAQRYALPRIAAETIEVYQQAIERRAGHRARTPHAAPAFRSEGAFL